MSMLSSQCDTLRVAADALEDEGVIPDCAKLMRDAADTIWELRCKCSDLMGEREEYVWTREFMNRVAEHCGTKDCPSLVAYVNKLETENEKLRELVRDMYIHIDQDSECPMCGYEPDGNPYTERLRELGIEVYDESE